MSSTPPIELRRARDFGQVIADAFTFMKGNWRPLLGAMLRIAMLPLVVLVALAGAIAIVGLIQGRDGAALIGGLGILTFALLFPVMIYTAVMIEAVTHEYLRAYGRGEHHVLDTRELRRRCHGQFWSYLGIWFLATLATLIGALMCYIPGIWINTSFALAMIAHGEERLGATGSLERSYKLVNKKWWATFGLVLVLGMIAGMLAMVVIVPFYITAMVVMVMGAVGGGSEPPILMFVFLGIGYLLMILVSFLAIPLVRTGTGLWYFSLVEQMEGAGLRERIQGFEQA
ncbi:MAG: hypothetical protein JNM49_11100 [Flavobacteriales bacterium]|nr:hypothetical protein [Flavobacteriales bacterium]